MHVLVTGAGGTLGPRVVHALEGRLWRVSVWDRAAVSPDDREACQRHLDAVDPDAVVHLALGPEAWGGQLAAWCAARQRPLVVTSSAMVFGNQPDGPHRPGDARTGTDDYGRYKARCEDAVLAAHPAATVVRIGWQIGLSRTGKNDMLESLHQQAARDGAIAASRRWIPACSFLVDTAAALGELLVAPVAGVVHLDANAETAWTFDALVQALAAGPGDATWTVAPHEDYVHDQRLLDGRPGVPRVVSLASRLGAGVA